MKILEFAPTYKTDESVSIIDESSIPIPSDFLIKERSVVIFPPGSKAGNHEHPRKEIFYSIGDLTLVYRNKKGSEEAISMAPDRGKFKLFIIDAMLPHAVINDSDRELAMIEFANAKQHNVHEIKLI